MLWMSLLLAAILLVGAAFASSRLWPEHLEVRWAIVLPLVAVLWGGIALDRASQQEQARYLSALRSDPFLLADPGDPQRQKGVALQILAWPLALAVGDETAIRTIALFALGGTVLLVSVAARAAGLGPALALLAQALLVVLPATSCRLLLGLSPSLLGQSMEALLVAHLARRLRFLSGARDAAATCIFLFIAQLAHPASLASVGVLVVLLGSWETLAGDWRRGLRLLGAYGIAAALVFAMRYATLLPGLGQSLAVHTPASMAEAGARLLFFHGPIVSVLVGVGLVALRDAPLHPRRVVVAALVSGIVLLALARVVPFLALEMNEMSFLALPVSVTAAAGLDWIGRRGRAGRLATIALAAASLLWGIGRAFVLWNEGAATLR